MHFSELHDLSRERQKSHDLLLKDRDPAYIKVSKPYFDCIDDVASRLLSLVSDPVAQRDLVDAALSIYVGVNIFYGRMTDEAARAMYGDHLLALIGQTTAIQDALKLNRPIDPLKPFLPGVQAGMACSIIEAAKRYIVGEGFEGVDPEIARHYASFIARGCDLLNDENLPPPLRRGLGQAKDDLEAFLAALGGPAFIEDPHLTAMHEVRSRKPG